MCIRDSCKCCGDFYIGKTQNDVKTRIWKHVQDVGKFWKKRKDFNSAFDIMEEECQSILSGSANSMVTRSQVRNAVALRTPASRSAMSCLLSMLSSHLTSEQVPRTIFEDESPPDGDETSISTGGLSSPDNPSEPASPVSAAGSTSLNSTENAASVSSFQRAFQGFVNVSEIQVLEQMRTTILQPQLEECYNGIQCSTFSRHMWRHAREHTFAKNGDCLDWVRNNIEVTILHKGSEINAVKTAGTKDCRLCMKERIKLFFAFRQKKQKKNNLMNSKDERGGKCNCKARFLRLKAVEGGGADEATS